uniref:Uncharacterized protein n=1 Tax=Anguilla anguilla TaxID=7936 RepID=A0A0E9UV47_ANGAN
MNMDGCKVTTKTYINFKFPLKIFLKCRFIQIHLKTYPCLFYFSL